MKKKEERKPITIHFQHILIQFIIIIFYTVTWLNAPLFGIGELNINYFLFMFIAIFIGATVTLYSKANPEIPITPKPTQQFTNLAKAMADIITNFIGKQPPQVKEIKDIVQKALIWSLRQAKATSEIDQSLLEECEKYIFDKLFPEEEKKGETESQSTG